MAIEAQTQGKRTVSRIAVLVIFLVLANWIGFWLVDTLKAGYSGENEDLFHRFVLVMVVLYGFLIAIPFVPGIEIGLGLMVMIGYKLAAVLYFATVLGLTFSFLIGYFVPQNWIKTTFRFFFFERAAKLVEELENKTLDEKLQVLVSKAPGRYLPFILKHRYLALAIALNIPGNTLIGGGGGISLMAGLSRLYSPWAFIITLAFAILPVPLFVLTFGAMMPH